MMRIPFRALCRPRRWCRELVDDVLQIWPLGFAVLIDWTGRTWQLTSIGRQRYQSLVVETGRSSAA